MCGYLSGSGMLMSVSLMLRYCSGGSGAVIPGVAHTCTDTCNASHHTPLLWVVWCSQRSSASVYVRDCTVVRRVRSPGRLSAVSLVCYNRGRRL